MQLSRKSNCRVASLNFKSPHNLLMEQTTDKQKKEENMARLNRIIVSYKGLCPWCEKGHICYRTKKTDTPTLTFLGCDRFPKCLWTSYKETL